MMPSYFNTTMAGSQHYPSASYITDAAMLDELSRQLAATTSSRRFSKGSGNQPRVGNMGTAMRITKPGSANNSPRSMGFHARRKTMVGEGQQQRPHLQPVDMGYLAAPSHAVSRDLGYEPEKRPTRPVSWHPSSQPQLQHGPQLPFPQPMSMGYPFPNFNEADLFANYQQFPPTPITYSGYASPASTFSPLSLPYSSAGSQSSQQYHSPATQAIPNQQTQQQQQAYFQTYNPATHSGSSSAVSSTEMPYLPPPTVTGGSLDWEVFRTHGFDKYAAPPTPEDCVSRPPLPMPNMKADVSLPPPQVASEDAVAFQALGDDESDGEILYGMGLYDKPDGSRSSVFSLMDGTYPKPTGKGLKLEDAWEPPVSDDEEEEEKESGDDENDADGEDS